MSYFEGEIFEKGADMDLRGAEFIDCQFNDIDFTASDFRDSKVLESTFNHCNLSNISLVNGTLRDVKFNECKVIGVNFSSLKSISHLEFLDCLIQLSVFQELKVAEFKAEKCQVKECDFSDSELRGSVFDRCDLLQTQFLRTDLRDSDFRNSFHYDIDVRLARVENARFSLPEATSLLKHLQIKIEN